jgi:hypothetical protein
VLTLPEALNVTHFTFERSQRCLFLELPPEVRIIIYEQLEQLQLPDLGNLCIEHPFVHLYGDVPKALALTQVNRQIRRESLPILYRNVHIRIETGSDKDQRCVDHWMESVDWAILHAVSKYTFYPFEHCYSGIVLHLGDLHNTVQTIGRQEWCFSSHREGLRTYEDKMKAEVAKLQILGAKRRLMTKVTMQTLMQLSYNVAQQREKVREES